MNGEDMAPDIEPITPRTSPVSFYQDRHVVAVLQYWLVVLPLDEPLILWLVSTAVYWWGIYGLCKTTANHRRSRR